MPIEWRPGLSVGDARLDEDHRRLIDLINRYEVAVAAENHPAIETIFVALGTYAREHFDREIAMMRKVGFPRVDEHQILHERILRDLTRLHVAFGRNPHSLAPLVEMSQLLRDWVVRHLLEEDRQLKDYLDAAALAESA